MDPLPVRPAPTGAPAAAPAAAPAPAAAAPRLDRLHYDPPVEGVNYWVLDDALPHPLAVRGRQFARRDWVAGFPHRPEPWPGRRAQPALMPDELAPLEAWVRARTGAARIFARDPGAAAAPGDRFNHNCVQVVSSAEGQVRPHTDSRALCRYAAVLYLTPDGPPAAGTTFFRVRHPDGTPGGNTFGPEHANLVEAFGTRFVPPDTFVPDVAIPYRFNRLLVYRADLIHSASGYFGRAPHEMRMACVFFWQAEDGAPAA